jgi:hypothetical protein
VKIAEIGMGFPDTVPLARIDSKMTLPLGAFLAQEQISEGHGNDVGAIIALTTLETARKITSPYEAVDD